MPEPTFDAEQAARAANAMRAAANLPPEQFPLPQVVAMLSDEISILRGKGFDDERIAQIVSSTGVAIDAESLGRYYVDTSEMPRQA